eukprot:scaffold42013_cov38-Prasinocladus_malaysianus.AAC.1
MGDLLGWMTGRMRVFVAAWLLILPFSMWVQAFDHESYTPASNIEVRQPERKSQDLWFDLTIQCNIKQHKHANKRQRRSCCESHCTDWPYGGSNGFSRAEVHWHGAAAAGGFLSIATSGSPEAQYRVMKLDH